MIRIEIKEISKGHAGISLEAEKTDSIEVLQLAIRGVAGLVRIFMKGNNISPELAEALGNALEMERTDSNGLRVSNKLEGKEAEFMAALYGMRGKTMKSDDK